MHGNNSTFPQNKFFYVPFEFLVVTKSGPSKIDVVETPQCGGHISKLIVLKHYFGSPQVSTELYTHEV
jgi:hypothetical protein